MIRTNSASDLSAIALFEKSQQTEFLSKARNQRTEKPRPISQIATSSNVGRELVAVSFVTFDVASCEP